MSNLVRKVILLKKNPTVGESIRVQVQVANSAAT
jgi:hypothetical protein